jgi:hypothetical protein
MVDARLHHRRIRPAFAAPRDPQYPRQCNDPTIDLRERSRTNQVRPTNQGCIIGDRLQIDPTELAQDQTVRDKVLGLGVAPAIQPLDDQHPQNDLNRGGKPSAAEGLGRPAGKVRLHRLKQDVIVQQAVELGENRNHRPAQRGNQGEKVHRIVAITQHGEFP